MQRIKDLLRCLPKESILRESLFMARYVSIGAIAAILFQDNTKVIFCVVVWLCCFIAAIIIGGKLDGVTAEKECDK